MNMFFSFRLPKRAAALVGILALLALPCGVAARSYLAPVGCTQSDIAPTTQQISAATQGVADETAPESVDKVVYLTFDDGPTATTQAVLDILSQEGVPATFFVVSAPQNEAYFPLLTRMAAEGHTIALHSDSHSYKDIYASAEAFWADLETLKEKIRPYVPSADIAWMRFPGGSTNTVSHRYGGSALMQTLKAQAAEKGYHYVDWNVDAGDAVGGKHSAQTVYQNVIKGAQGKNSCIVLMHDTKATATSADALTQIIPWFRAQGYRFDTINHLPTA
jgi:peptidoglycan/xylan/chitin deacetylase (PgdA/CDA1 family)